MPRTRIVDGREIHLSSEEESARDAEESAYEAARPMKISKAVLREKYVKAREAFLKEQISLRAKDADAPQEIKDWDAQRRM